MLGRLKVRHTVVVLAAACALVAGPAWATPTTWSLVPVRAPGTLYSVSCTSPTFCAAVGAADDQIGRSELLMYDGTTWTRVSPRAGGSVLTAVSCVSASFCIAVGIRDGSPQRTLIYQWNGAQWTRQRSANHGRDDSQLYGVSCASATACTAVGFAYTEPHVHPLVESWNGTSWSIVRTRSAPNRDSVLYAVSCVQATHCVAVGEISQNGDAARPLIETFDGASWTTVPSPHLASAGYFGGISCVSTSTCVATGLLIKSSGSFATLAATGNGTSWTVSPTPNPGPTLGELDSVSCTTATSCIAVGAYDAPNRHIDTLIESWNGAEWSVPSSPSTTTTENYLNGVSCASDNACTAVGFSIDGVLVLGGE